MLVIIFATTQYGIIMLLLESNTVLVCEEFEKKKDLRWELCFDVCSLKKGCTQKPS